MKLSFSTNGWDAFNWTDFYTMAKDLQFAGIEIHDIKKEIFSGKNKPFNEENIVETSRKLAQIELAISCIDTTCDLADADRIEENVAEIEERIEQARILKCTNVRLRAGKNAADTAVCDDAVIACIQRTYRTADNAGVSLLIETVGAYADTGRLRNVLNVFARDNVAALWDFHHTYRIGGEATETSIQNLGAYVKHVHVKDSEVTDSTINYCLLGEGTLPMDELMNALRSINYEGFISLEWIPAWMEEIGDPGIVFPHFVNYMNRYEKQTMGSAKRLYRNKAGNGRFVWEKENHR